MAIKIILKENFENKNIHYDTIKHRKSFAILDSSRSAHLPADKVAKAVVLQSEDGDYLMASLPENRHKLAHISDYRQHLTISIFKLFQD
jgi:Ala-tRNA(Pro) deacylase